MPKVTFEFVLPEEQHEYELASQSLKVHSFLWDFNQQLRSYYKYGHQFTDADDAVNKIREDFYRLLDQHRVDIDL